jgi:hypothetical protein
MAITDIEISEELMTNAPSIKYSGDEGPKSPQEEQRMMVAQLEEAYDQYVNEMIEMGQEDSIITLQQFMEQAMAEGQMSGGQPLPQDPTKPVNPFQPKPMGPPLPDRQMAARGGIMGADGRTGFLFGGIKKRIRKLIPNEIAEVAEKVAPFVAPFNPLAAGIASAVGSFDRTGRVGSSLMSGLKNYGIGQLTRGIGGGIDNLQASPFQASSFKEAFKVPMGGSGLGKYFSSPIQNTGGLGAKILSKPTQQVTFDASGIKSPVNNVTDLDELTSMVVKDVTAPKPTLLKDTIRSIGEYIPTSLGDLSDPKKLLGGAGIIFAAKEMLGGGPEEVVAEIMDRGEGLDIAGIRAEVQAAFKDPTGEQLSALRVKYPFLGTQASKNLAAMAMGGRAGFAEGGGIMDLGGMEKDYRAEGGFVPIGREEKADDVPARLSVNEFVFTADAVRNAGGGDIDKGAEVMENMMKHLEQGGQVSDESQGMAGAQQMFETSERLSEVI